MKTFNEQGEIVDAPDTTVFNDLTQAPVFEGLPDGEDVFVPVTLRTPSGKPRLVLMRPSALAFAAEVERIAGAMQDDIERISGAMQEDIDGIKTGLGGFATTQSLTALAQIVVETEQAALGASGKADAAAQAASAAAGVAGAAQEAAEAATGRAGAAETAASTAAARAAAAETAAGQAGTKADTATSAASAAGQAAVRAETDAANASTAAASASTAAAGAVSRANEVGGMVVVRPRLFELPTQTLSYNATVAVGASARRVQRSPVTGVRTTDLLIARPVVPMPDGYMLGDVTCPANGTVDFRIFHPALVLGARFDIEVRLFALRMETVAA